MATIISILSSKVDNSTGKAEISIRLRHGKNIDQQTGTFIYVLPEFFSNGKIVINQRIITPKVKEAQYAKWNLENLINYITTKFQEDNVNGTLPRKWLFETIDRYTFPEKYEAKKGVEKVPFFDLLHDYIHTQKFSQGRIRHYLVLYRSLKRFELYYYLNLDIDTFSSEELHKYNSFLTDEYKLFTPNEQGIMRPKQSYVKIFETFKERRPPKPRGIHYIASVEIMLRAFFSWCIKTEKTTNDPFRSYSIKTIEFGTPYYLTLEERDRIYQTDLSSEPQMEILNKYKSTERKSLLPFISSQKYNDYIKQILHTCGIDRMVTVLNPTTGESEQRCIADVASSHIARRTFIGNLYKKVKDPNLVGKLSGHKEGSRAFARYRDIDDEMISDLTNLL